MVITGEHYERAPIIEALVELRVISDVEVGPDKLLSVMDGVPGYVPAETLVSVQGELQILANEVQARASGTQIGFRWCSEDGKHVVQARPDVFVFSRLAPYDRWESLLIEVEVAWLRYKAVVEPTTVVGASVRFINRIDVPSERPVEIKDYLRLSVDVPPYLPQVMLGMYMQVAVPLPQHEGAVANVISTLAPPQEGMHSALILDINAQVSTMINITDDKFEQQIQHVLATLRNAKNYVFEACITDATRGLIR